MTVEIARWPGDDELTAQEVGALERALRRNPVVMAILERAPALGLPAWYLGAGGVTQTVWNVLRQFEPTRGIKDYDLGYFDGSDLSADAEAAAQRCADEFLADLGVKLDVKNEARVHLWYDERFGRSIPPYRSTEHAISTWPTTASSIGVRLDDAELVVCAPFGLADLFAMIVRPNKAYVPQDVDEAKPDGGPRSGRSSPSSPGRRLCAPRQRLVLGDGGLVLSLRR